MQFARRCHKVVLLPLSLLLMVWLVLGVAGPAASAKAASIHKAGAGSVFIQTPKSEAAPIGHKIQLPLFACTGLAGNSAAEPLTRERKQLMAVNAYARNTFYTHVTINAP